MPEAIPFVLWAWVPATLLLFWKFSPAKAAAISLVGGWLILPTARFADDVAGVSFPYWIMPACLPSDYWTTKARVIGVALVLGIAAFDPGARARFRPSWFDLPMLGWCLVPLVSGLSAGVDPVVALANAAYQSMAWGVPYLVGRVYFADPSGMNLLARSVVGGGLACLPGSLFEFARGPELYRWFYGFHPYRTPGMDRYVGFRPVLFFEDGNELGVWLAASSLTAWWLQRSGSLGRFWGMPGGLVAALLVLQALLSQSAGAVALMVGGALTLEVLYRVGRPWPLAALGAALLLLVGARATNLVDAEAIARKTAIGRRLIEASSSLDRRSFGWRLKVEERGVKLALQRPTLGRGRWDWWRDARGEERPWGLVVLTLGMFGLVGWALLLAVFAAPVAALLKAGPPALWVAPNRAPAAALAGALVLVGLDAILNPGVILMFLAVAGGLVGLERHAKAASAWLRRVQGLLQ